MSIPRSTAYFITHPDVLIDPGVPVQDWPLSARGRARMTRALALPWVNGIRTIWCSTERKARDGADILSASLGLPVTELAGLGENDRSASGFLPRPEFEAVADLFFAQPTSNVRGWESAADAQSRIIAAFNHVLGASAGYNGDIAIVSHGAVGTLLLCHLGGWAISRQLDQPPNNGGNYFAIDMQTRRLHHGWRPIDRS